MKKISYSTTMALLLACSALTTSAIASDATTNKDATETVDELIGQDVSTQRSTTTGSQQTTTLPNLNMQSAPTLGEMVFGAASKLAKVPGALAQAALGAAGVQTKVVYIQPLSAFEIAAADRIASEKAEAKENTCESKAETRCKTIRAYQASIDQRNQTDLTFLRNNFTKIFNTPEKITAYIKETNPEILRELAARRYFQNGIKEADSAEILQQIVVAPRGLGLQPGMHAMIKDGYHYSIFTGSPLCKLPTDYDLRTSSKVTGANFPMILNQGGTEACVAHAFSSALNFARRAQGLTDGRVPSRHFIWSWARQIGSSGQPFDGKLHKGLGNWGCNMGIAGDLVSNQGASSESDIGSEWYGDMDWHAGASNSATSYDSNLLSLLGHAETDVASPLVFINQSDTNTRDLNALAIKCALHNGYPVLAAIDVRRSSYFNGAANSTGDWVTPFSDETVNNTVDAEHPVGKNADGTYVYAAGDYSVGGHAILLVGYDDNAKNSDGTPNGRFTFMNSWGTGWGNNGFGTLPYEYLCGTSASYTTHPEITAGQAEADVLNKSLKDDPEGTKVHVSLDKTAFSNAPYGGFYAQIKSCTK